MLPARSKVFFNAHSIQGAVEENDETHAEFVFQGKEKEQSVKVHHQLPVQFLYDGKETGISLYRAKMESGEALLWLDDQSIQISQLQGTLSDNEALHTVISDNQVNEFSLNEETVSFLPEFPTDKLADASRVHLAKTSSADTPLTVHLFKNYKIHTSYSGLMILYFNKWSNHMDKMNHDHKKKGNPALFSRLIFNWVPAGSIPIQNRAYYWHTVFTNRDDKIKAMLNEFYQSLQPWYARQTTQYPPSHTKFIYFENVVDAGGFKELESWHGADPERQIGFTIDSVSGERRRPAHILGTLMGASSEYSKIQWFPWPCETFTRPYSTSSNITRNCGEYSQKNKKRIIQYLQSQGRINQ